MSSIRYKILSALDGKGVIPIEDLQDCLDEPNRRRIIDNVNKCIESALVTRHKDDITGGLAYKITPTGSARLKASKSQLCNDKPQADNLAGRKPEKREIRTEDILIGTIAEIRAAINDTGELMLDELPGAIRAHMERLQVLEDDTTRLSRKCHDLGNDAAGYRMLLEQIAGQLGADQIESIPDIIERMTDPVASTPPAEPDGGHSHYICVAASDDIDIHPTPGNAMTEAEQRIIDGRGPVLVCQIHARAEPTVQWFMEP